jgi:hypothetical protein
LKKTFKNGGRIYKRKAKRDYEPYQEQEYKAGISPSITGEFSLLSIGV